MKNQNPAEVIRFTREDLEGVMAEGFGVAADDVRLPGVYEEYVLAACDYVPDSAAYFATMTRRDVAIANELDVILLQQWMGGRQLLSPTKPRGRRMA